MSLCCSFSEGKVKFWVIELRLSLRKVALSIGMRLGRQSRYWAGTDDPRSGSPLGTFLTIKHSDYSKNN